MAAFLWAEERHFPAVCRLWKQGFPEDGEEEISVFWRAFRTKAKCLLLIEEDAVRSMAFLIPTVLRKEKEAYPLWYVYAAVTDPAFRGQGCFSRLLEEAALRAEQASVWGLCLRPATPSLFTYYARCGFQTAFSVTRECCEGNPLHTNILWRPMTTGYAAERDRWLIKIRIPFLQWGDTLADMAVQLADGALVSSQGVVLYREDKDAVYFEEVLCAPENREAVLSSLTRCFPCRKCYVQQPVFGETETVAFGMIRPTAGQKITDTSWYMGLTLE